MKIVINTNVEKSKWIQFIEQNRYSKQHEHPDNLEIDFGASFFMEPFHLVSLACIIEEYSINGTEISFSTFDNLGLYEYLSSRYFFRYWEDGFDRFEKYFNNSSTTLRLWKVNASQISGYVYNAQKYYEASYLGEKDAEPFNTSLAELFNNIIDHANSAVSGFVLNQYYPSSNKLKIVLCDLGVGIARKINDYIVEKGGARMSDQAAILKAFELSFSSESKPHNAGRGLDTLKNIVSNCNGILRLVSNSYCLSYNINGDGAFSGFTLENEFSGTLFEIILDINSFDEKSEEEFDLDF